MAPINAVEILEAFTPLLTENGGIKPLEDQQQLQKIYDLMRNCSTKLVSKCIYCKILLSTKGDVLEEFLNIGGWDLIYLWVKSSRDVGNVSFLLCLLDLLSNLPMTINRLRQNECPKIVKKLCKHDDGNISTKANQIIKKWTKIIHALSENSSSKSLTSNGQNGTTKSEKKRKTVELSTMNSSDNVNKKSKSNNESNVINSNKHSNNDNTSTSNNHTLSDADPYETYSRDEMNNFLVVKEPSSQDARRPVTAKVKPGKFRLDLSTSTTIKPNDKASLVKKKESKVIDLKKLPPKKPSLDIANSQINKNSSHVLKDSMSFMDALTMVPVVPNKKRRKLNKENENKLVSFSQQETNNSSNSSSNVDGEVVSDVGNEGCSNTNNENPNDIISPLVNVNSNKITNNNSLLNDVDDGTMMISSSNNNNNNNIKTSSMMISLNDFKNKESFKSDNLETNNKRKLLDTNKLDDSNENENRNNILNITKNSEPKNNMNDNSNNNDDDDETLKKSSNDSYSPSSSTPRFSFYKDILDEKTSDNNVTSPSGKDETNEFSSRDSMMMNNRNDDEKSSNDPQEENRDRKNDSAATVISNYPAIDSQDSSSSSSFLDSRKNESSSIIVFKSDSTTVNQKYKSILSSAERIKDRKFKKSVRWPEDSKLEYIKFFEVDETERINVTRMASSTVNSTLGDMKRFDMKSEGQLMMEAKRVRCFTYAQWRLISIDLDPQVLAFEKGRLSEEKTIQMDRIRTRLEAFYLHNQIPDSAMEPDFEFSTSNDKTVKIIPLEDENSLSMMMPVPSSDSNVISDSSNFALPPPATQQPMMSLVPNIENNYLGAGNSNPSQPFIDPPLIFNHSNVVPIGEPNPFDIPNTPNYQTSVTPYGDSNDSSYVPSTPPFNSDINASNNPNYPFNNNYTMPPLSNQASLPPPIDSLSAPPYQDYGNHQFGPNATQYSAQSHPNSPPNLFNNNSFYNPNDPMAGGPPNDNFNPNNNNPFWKPPDNMPFNYPRGGALPQHRNGPPPRGFRPRGGGGGGGDGPRSFHPRGGGGGGPPSNVCRFFFKTGKCKFDTRCNFSHSIENMRPPVRY